MDEQMPPTVTMTFFVMKKAGQGRVLHAVPPAGQRWGKAICGEKTGTKWEHGPWGSVVTCPGCRRKLGAGLVAST